MATLIIHAPKAMVAQEQKKSFQNTLESGVGEGYAIAKADHDRLAAGCVVVVLSKDEKRRAEGTLARLIPNGKTKGGMQRYDVHIRGLTEVAYQPEPLGRTGVSVI
jgi:hypothetical protein